MYLREKESRRGTKAKAEGENPNKTPHPAQSLKAGSHGLKIMTQTNIKSQTANRQLPRDP